MNMLLNLACLAALASFAAAGCGGGSSCIDDATCVGGQCVCNNPYVWGDGTFACYKKNTVAAEAKNDPMLTNYNNESLPFPFPCRYLVSHVKQNLKDRNRDVIGECEFKIYAFNAKHKGKYFVHGFDVATRIKYDSGREVLSSSRNWGVARNGNYRFWTQGTNNEFRENGPWDNDDINYRDDANGLKVEVKESPANKQLRYEFRKCGVIITFVPYDVVKRRSQVQVPGLSVGINCAMKPRWLSPNKVMAMGPAFDGGNTFSDFKYTGLNLERSIFARAFARQFTQNQIADDNGQCDAVSGALDKCTWRERSQAFESCYWIIKAPRFVRCVDKTMGAKDVLELFRKCVSMVCDQSMTCADVQQAVIDTGCTGVPRLPKLRQFMRGNLCP